MGIDGQVVAVSGPRILEEVAGHPVVFARAGDVLHQLAEVAAVELGAALAGGADEADGEPRVVGHRDERRLAVAREPLDADLLGVDGFVGLEIVEGAAGSPGPGPQRAPVVELAGLALVAQADDALASAPRRCRPGCCSGR